jgi:chromosome segregation ATPase
MAGVGLLSPAGASADNLSVLIAQRQALQRQVEGVGSSRYSVVGQLLLTRDRIADLQRQVDRNAASLSDLDQQQAQLARAVEATRAAIQSRKDTLASVVRQQYKDRDQRSLAQIFFGSHTVNQVVGRIADAQAVGDKLHRLVGELRGAERDLAQQSAALGRDQAAARQIQDQLTGQRQQLFDLAAGYKRRIDALDATSNGLLQRIRQVDDAIAAAVGGPGNGGPLTRQQIIAIIRAAADRYNDNGDQLVRVANCESHLNPRAYDQASGASGLFQFMPGTFYAHGGHDIWDAADQSDVAAKMFSQGYSYEWTCR